MRALSLATLGLLLPALLAAQSPATDVTIGKRDSVWSGTLKENRRYLVYTPPSYNDTVYEPQRYPVLYLLDGDAHFHSVTGLLQILGTGVNGTYVLPEMIVVAIPNTDRSRDLTPTASDAGPDGKPTPAGRRTSGGMANFFSFMKSELIPKIDSQYRTMPYRVFVGHSLGGITTINALYTIPETFNAYVAIDPSLWWDNKLLLRKAKDYFSTAKLQNKALFVGQANTLAPGDTAINHHFNAIMQFNEVLEAYNTSGLRYGYKYYDHDDHGSVPLITEYDALHFIFDGWKVNRTLVMANPSLLTDHYRTLSAKLGATFRPSEASVMRLGLGALSQDTAKAIRFFEIASELYPTSHRGLDRLGAISAARGDTKKAIGYYEKALLVNPNDKIAQDGLGKLKR